MRRLAILGRMISTLASRYTTGTRCAKPLPTLFMVIRAVSAVFLFLSATARAQGPVTSIVGNEDFWNQAQQVWSAGQAAKNQYAPANPVQLAADSIAGVVAHETLEPGEKHTPLETFAASGDVSALPCAKAADVASSASSKPLSAAEECSLKPKDVFKECDNCPEMVVVQAGEFTMGSPDDEPDRNKSEGPQHKVTIARPFAVGRFAVTFDEWGACVAAGGCNGFRPDDQGWGRGNRPVIYVSWDDAQAYAAWLSRATGKTYRLLTEAEREYVTRAGTTTPFWFGATISPEQANFDGKHPYNNGPMSPGRGQTLAVDAFQPNPWGLYQVHGNVWDWVEDCFNDSYVGAPADGSAWMSGDCDKHMLRGGSWVDQPRFLRSAFRLGDVTSRRYDLQGFRVARTLGP
jgi:formylglycine-generating enzyme required for sulfatase activity